MERALKDKLERGRFGNVSSARSRTMSAIRSHGNRTTELALRMALVRAGFSGWRLHPAGLPGRPDLVFTKARIAVFVDGCFWHGCPRCYTRRPRTNPSYWATKILRNQQRDRRAAKNLRKLGMTVVRVRECELAKRPQHVLIRITRALSAVEQSRLGPKMRNRL